MSEQIGEKTEKPTAKRLEEAAKRGQFARSAEIETVMVLGAGTLALMFTGQETWRQLVMSLVSMLSHLHDIPLSDNVLQGYFIAGALQFCKCVWPVVVAAMLAGMLAGGLQSRFQTASEILELNWERINPVSGLTRIFSFRSLPTAGLALLKLAIVMLLTYGEVRSILSDPIFWSAVSTARIAEFMATSASKIILRVGLALVAIAAIDYAYQFWRTNQDLMMTKEEVKEEAKNAEGNPETKAALKRRHRQAGKRKMLLEVPRADVIVTNPTHLAVALRYDRRNMRAPKVVAKGSRLNALRIREIAKQHQVPIVENKPLARMLFKYAKVGGEIPAQLYAAVAEILAWVYRVNRYRYYTEQNQA